MTFRPTALERAFDLAKTGEYAGAADIVKQLKAEGFTTTQISGGTLSRQLRALCVAAKATAE
jgi:arginine repressor